MSDFQQLREASGAGRLAAFGQTIFAEMTALAAQTGAVNLGQGFPDTDGPQELMRAAQDAIAHGANQYAPLHGLPALREAVAEHQRHWYGLDLDPTSQVLVTAGATEALTTAILGLCGPGDEVLMLEPYYDLYATATALAGATRVTVPLRFPDWRLDLDALRAAFSPRTRMVVINSPHNPTGAVLTREELTEIAALAVEFDALVLTDEVYEHLTFDGVPHVPMATLPGMQERTLTVSGAGKTFSVTGWRIGWVTGPEPLLRQLASVKQFLSFVAATPLQQAVVTGLGLPDESFHSFAASLQGKRDLLVDALRDLGLQVSVPKGTYFVVADVAPLGTDDALELCRTRLPHEAGVVAIPLGGFCDAPQHVRTLVRFAFCKQDEVLREATRRLQTLRT